MGAAVFLVHGQKALKGEAACGLAGGRQSGYQGTGTRDGTHRDPQGGALGHQLLAGVGDGGHPCVGDQGAILSSQQPVQHRPAAAVGIVAVIGHHGLFQPQVIEQFDGYPCVFGGDEVRLSQSVRHPLGDIP